MPKGKYKKTKQITLKHSTAERNEAILLFNNGMSLLQISKKLNIPVTTIHYWKQVKDKKWNNGKNMCKCGKKLRNYASNECKTCFVSHGNKYWKDKKRPEEDKQKMRVPKPNSQKENHHRWVKDRTQIKKQEERNNPNDKQWKYAVYKRDNFICRLKSDECKGRLEAHHILSWRNYPELRFIINNGITLCHFHHPRVREEEKRMIPIFQELLSVSKE